MTEQPSVYRPCAPAPSLASLFEASWEVDPAGATRHSVMPDGCLDVIFSERAGLQIVGAMTRWNEVDLPAGASVIGVRFRPGGARSFLGVPVSLFTDRIVPAEDIWGRAARQLCEQAGNARSRAEALERLGCGVAALARRVEDASPAVRSILLGAGASSIDAAARRTGLSVRQFRRRCIEETGLSPKHLSRVLRFRRAARLLAARAADGAAAVAAECGYYDQAHLIRDFQLLAGRSPLAYLRGPQGSEVDPF